MHGLMWIVKRSYLNCAILTISIMRDAFLIVPSVPSTTGVSLKSDSNLDGSMSHACLFALVEMIGRPMPSQSARQVGCVDILNAILSF